MGPGTDCWQTAIAVIFLVCRKRPFAHHPRLTVRGMIRIGVRGFYGDAGWDTDLRNVDTVSSLTAVGFNDITWLAGRGGYFHGATSCVMVERFRRDGDTLHYAGHAQKIRKCCWSPG